MNNNITCRIAVIGSNQLRIIKVIGLLSQTFSSKQEPSTSIGTLATVIIEPSSASSKHNDGNTFNISSSTSCSVTSTSTNRQPSCCSFSYPLINNVTHEIIQTITVEYLPCVATFDSYTNDQDETVEYLAKVEYHGYDGKSKRGSSLAPFFDDTAYMDDIDNDDDDNVLQKQGKINNQKMKKKKKKNPIVHFSGIAGVVIGCGIESKSQIQMIESFIQSFSICPVLHRRDFATDTTTVTATPTAIKSQHDDDHGTVVAVDVVVDSTMKNDSNKITAIAKNQWIQPVVFDYVQCNMELFHSLTEENEAFRNLSEEDKSIATKLGAMGPGKMVHLVQSVTDSILDSYSRKSQELLHEQQHLNIDKIPQPPTTSATTEITSKEDVGHQDLSSIMKDFEIYHVQEYALDRIRFACKVCRTYLFSIQDLEDPPHYKSNNPCFRRNNRTTKGPGKIGGLGLQQQQQQYSAPSTTGTCESLFLSMALPWMGNVSDTEGKLACPKCSSKVGQWNWSGTQCSCGAWITPAIQIPCSRVDMIYPTTKTQTTT